jgi:major outer membrane protein
MNKMHHSSHGLRIALLAGASVVALAAAAPSAGAADLNKPTLTKAPPLAPAPKDTWTWWIEGGAVNANNKSINLGAGGIKPGWGPEGAVGFDWQPFAPMHVVGQFRYGSTRKSAPFAFGFSGVTTGGSAFTGKAAGNQSVRDDHWLIDFAIGRDFGLGAPDHAMWTLGVRVADLRAKLTANGSFVTTGATSTTGTFNTVQRSTFVGAGPRFGVQGDIPLGGQWSIDWLAGAAVLFGERSLTQNTTAVFVASPTVSTSAGASDSAAVFNLDAQAGLSYWLTPATKVTASYRFDGYWRALKNVQAVNGTAIAVSNVDQFFSGPMLRLTSKF